MAERRPSPALCVVPSPQPSHAPARRGPAWEGLRLNSSMPMAAAKGTARAGLSRSNSPSSKINKKELGRNSHYQAIRCGPTLAGCPGALASNTSIRLRMAGLRPSDDRTCVGVRGGRGVRGRVRSLVSCSDNGDDTDTGNEESRMPQANMSTASAGRVVDGRVRACSHVLRACRILARRSPRVRLARDEAQTRTRTRTKTTVLTTTTTRRGLQ